MRQRKLWMGGGGRLGTQTLSTTSCRLKSLVFVFYKMESMMATTHSGFLRLLVCLAQSVCF